MKKLSILFFSLMVLAAQAQYHITEQQARQRIGEAVPTLDTPRMRKAPQQADALYYIFDKADGGYVIASADLRARAILGWCDEGEWDAASIPPAMQGWLNEMTEALRALAASDAAPLLAPAQRAEGKRVEPLLGDIKWGQGEPYYNLCPQHSATGCAATAMAQILRYHQYPKQGAGSHSYTTQTLKYELSEDFSTTTYDWDNMLTQYTMKADGSVRYYNDTQAQAVATLMYHLGVASDMDYAAGASGTTEGPMLRALLENFQLDRGLQIYYRDQFTSSQWYDILRSEIDAKRPVLMNGYSLSGGHAFVIDGYDTTKGDSYFHFNWGWNGMSDGYYSVDVTDPGQQGTGGSLGGYSHKQNIFTGIQPPVAGHQDAQFNLCMSDAMRWKNGMVYFQFLNRGCGTFSGEVGYAVEMQGTTSFTSLKSFTNLEFTYGGGSQRFTPTLREGQRYYIAYRAQGSTEVKPVRPIVGTSGVLLCVKDASGNLTLQEEAAELPRLSVSDFKLDGPAYAGNTINFSFRLTNEAGAAEYNSAVYLSLTPLSEDGQEGYEERMTDNPLGVYAIPGQTRDYSIPYYGTAAAGKHIVRLYYNRRNASGLAFIQGSEIEIEVVPYQHKVVVPLVIKNATSTLSATSVQRGGILTLTTTLTKTGGDENVEVSGIIFQKKGSSPFTYLGRRIVNIPNSSEPTTIICTGKVDLEPGDYRMLFGWDDDGWWEYANYQYLNFTVTEAPEAISQLSAPNSQHSTLYDLSGRRVGNATRGLFIQNGHKVLR